MRCAEIALLEKWSIGKMTYRKDDLLKDDLLERWPVGNMAYWKYGLLERWPVGKMGRESGRLRHGKARRGYLTDVKSGCSEIVRCNGRCRFTSIPSLVAGRPLARDSRVPPCASRIAPNRAGRTRIDVVYGSVGTS